MKSRKNQILAVFSDVNFSPQLISILEELENHGGRLRIILIGDKEFEITKQIEAHGWDLKNLHRRGKFGSSLNFLMVNLEILKYRPNTLFASGQFATVIGMLSGKLFSVPQRVFIRHHSSFHHKYKMKFGMIVDRISNRLSTTIVAVSNVVKEILIRDELVSDDKVVVIYNGVKLINFKFKPLNSKLASEETGEQIPIFRIGVISRLTEWKGVEYTATAFARLQKEFLHTRLHIVGAFSDSYLDVKNILSEVALDTYTLDEINSDIPLFLHSLDAFVHVPVGEDDEAFGIVYIEALASGVPCIFTKSGVLNELKALDRYAHVVPFRNSEEIYLNLKKRIEGVNVTMIPVPELWLNQFSLEMMAKSYADLLLGED